MTVGFRKSLFGFNQDDVINYIQKTHKSFSQQTEELAKELKLSKEDYDKLMQEKKIVD